MYEKNTVEERCRRILEDNGGEVADQARTILLEDPALKDFRQSLEFISKNWRDPLTPALMRLSCEAVEGRSEETHEASLALSLMNLSFYIWDDIIDKAPIKLFKPTLFGKFGEGTALIVGGLASAKAFLILNQMNIDKSRRQILNKLFWNLWTKMARAEKTSLKIRNPKNFSSDKKLDKIKMEASADLEMCLKIGGILGNGSNNEIKHLGKYGLYLGMILELCKDFYVSFNLTLELAEKIRTNNLPYLLLLARERSESIRKKIADIEYGTEIRPSDIKEIVKKTIETKVLDNTIKSIQGFAKKAEEELNVLKRNKGTQTLAYVVKAQTELFIESVHMLNT